MAEGLRQWLPRVIQACKPFLSSEDIGKGRRWSPDLADRLAKSNFAILCMTPENLTAPWIHFEAGAVSKNPGISHISALLLNVKASDLVDPLAQFQHTMPNREDVRKLMFAINAATEMDRQIPAETLDWSFEQAWPDFENLLRRAEETLKRSATPAPPPRDPTELLEELLTLVRDLHRDHGTGLKSFQPFGLGGFGSPLTREQQESLGLLKGGLFGSELSDTPLALREAAKSEAKE